MDISQNRVAPGVLVISLSGEMDMYNSHELKELVVQTYQKSSDPVIIDMQHLKYIDSSGVSVLIYAFTQAKKAGIPLWFAHVEGTVRRVIELTSLLNFFPIEESVESAFTKAKQARS
jgi:anti-sigma B factor antagonist